VSAWQRLGGNERAIEQLRRAIARGRVPHAYLFAGPRDAPLVETALVVASALNCQRTPGDPCGECVSCAKIAAGIHPDVVTLVREGAGQIVPIERVREQVIARIGLPPHEADVRVFIVEEATAMAPPAANALLKTLEEPPPRTLFVLCTSAPEQLLPTIRSRCQRVRFAAGGASDPDPARTARVAALADELAGGEADPSLPGRVAEQKGDAPLVIVGAAQRLHARAREAADRGDAATAAREARKAAAVIAWQVPLVVHNANAQLAIEAIVAELAEVR
jgi:DNA polymerase III delta' subunit